MIVQRFLFIVITLTGTIGSSNVRYLTSELDSTVSLRCEIDQLPSNAVITWVFKPINLPIDGIKWLPLYANARRLTQNNQRFIVDYTGYNIKTKTHLSILTINHVNLTDVGIYMCKSNQHHSVPNLFNLTVTPSMKIYPNDGIIELPYHQRSLNISCSIRELPSNNVDPLELKWFHNNQEIKHQTISHLINKYPHHNQATLTLHIKHLSLNDSGYFKCVYRNSLIISKDVQIIFTSVLGYSKSTSSRINICSWSSFTSLLIVILIRQ